MQSCNQTLPNTTEKETGGKRIPFSPLNTAWISSLRSACESLPPQKGDIQKSSSQGHKEPINVCPKLEEVTENSALVLTHSPSDKVAFTTPSPPLASATNSLHRACCAVMLRKM